MSDLETFGGMSPAEWATFIAGLVDSAQSQAVLRAPGSRHDLARRVPGTVISVSADSVDVQFDADQVGNVTPCSPGAPAAPQQRGDVLLSPNGAPVWIGGSPVEAGSSGPVQVAPAKPYVPVTAATLPLVAQGTQPTGGVLKGVWSVIGGPWVAFSIEMLFGTAGTGVPVFVLPTLPVARRQAFNAYLVLQPSTVKRGAWAYSAFDGSTTNIAVDWLNPATGVPEALNSASPGTVNAGSTRLVINGIYEAQQ